MKVSFEEFTSEHELVPKVSPESRKPGKVLDSLERELGTQKNPEIYQKKPEFFQGNQTLFKNIEIPR